MWGRSYLFLILVRLYFALSTSYLHPDENFQGPEVIAGRIFSYPVHETWEFSIDKPIRSAFTLWPVYGLPMLILRWLWEGSGNGLVRPSLVFWTLRFLMFSLSFVLEDWAIYDLIGITRLRRVAIMLVASSYVTWSWQVHTFSNSIETLLVLWSLVLVQRLKQNKAQHSDVFTSAVLSFLLVFGTFNRITYPAFVALPILSLIPHIWRSPLILVVMAAVASLTTAMAILTDTVFYNPADVSLTHLIRNPVITPLNNLLYNTNPSNLALHGTHPFYLHFVANLPQFLGPAFPLLFGFARYELPLVSALCGVTILSVFSHQEARFLLPAVPLILSSIRVPFRYRRAWVCSWMVFNVMLGILMGVFHQGGVVPVQTFLETQSTISQAFWWKTYSPPVWLLNGRNDNMTTIDLMGLDEDLLEDNVCASRANGTVLVAPRSATFLDKFAVVNSIPSKAGPKMKLVELWSFQNHLNLDDMDFGGDGVWPTLKRVFGRRGLVAWRVECRQTPASVAGMMYGDW